MKHYFKEIVDVIQSTRKGMALTWKHAWDARKQRTQHNIQDETYFAQPTGIATLQYPHVDIPTPDNGRYQLHNEMDDCIVCDKCVKVCPVDCIDIEPIKATGLVGHASDGSPIRLYAAKFDIDMSKCCFCGLCTTVCPTECLTMTSEYDFSVFEVKDHNFSFANLTAEEAEEKKRLYEQFVAEKEAMKQAGDSGQLAVVSGQSSVVSGQSSVVSGQSSVVSPESDVPSPEVKKGAFKPSFKPKVVDSGQSSVVSPASDVQRPASVVPSPASTAKHTFKPSFKPKVVDSGQSSVDSPASEVQSPTSDSSPASKAKPTFKPSFKPKVVDSGQSSVDNPASDVQSPTSEVQSPASDESDVQHPASTAKPTFKPSFKPKTNVQSPTSDVQRPASNKENPDAK